MLLFLFFWTPFYPPGFLPCLTTHPPHSSPSNICIYMGRKTFYNQPWARNISESGIHLNSRVFVSKRSVRFSYWSRPVFPNLEGAVVVECFLGHCRSPNRCSTPRVRISSLIFGILKLACMCMYVWETGSLGENEALSFLRRDDVTPLKRPFSANVAQGVMG